LRNDRAGHCGLLFAGCVMCACIGRSARASGAFHQHATRVRRQRGGGGGAAPGRATMGRHAGGRRAACKERNARARGRSTRSAGADYPHPSHALAHAPHHGRPCSTPPSPAAQGDHARSVTPWFAHAHLSKNFHRAHPNGMAWPTPSKKKLSPSRRTADIALAPFQDCAYPPDMTRRVGASDT
jgi:hypothetical protein